MDLKKLQKIQLEIKGDKNLYNSFSKFNYRNIEGILKDLKPLLKATGTVIHFQDMVEVIGGWHYVCANVALLDVDTGEPIAQSTGYARESESRKGMDSSQITGSASSYARKYAISALLALSPAPDPDEMEPESSEGKNPEVENMKKILNAKQIPVGDFCKAVFKKSLNSLSRKQVESFLNRPDAAIEVYRKIKAEA